MKNRVQIEMNGAQARMLLDLLDDQIDEVQQNYEELRTAGHTHRDLKWHCQDRCVLLDLHTQVNKAYSAMKEAVEV